MAIIIPSKRIYEIQNPKVIENALRRIDVEQLEVDLEFTNSNTKHLEDVLENGVLGDVDTSEIYNRIFPTTDVEDMFGAGLRVDSTVYSTSVSLNRLQKEYYITKISPTIEVDFDVIISTVNAVSYLGVIPSGKKRIDFTPETENVYNSRQTSSNNFGYDNLVLSYDYSKNYKIEDAISVLPQKIKADFSVSNLSQAENSENRLASKITLTRTGSTINSIYPYSVNISSQNADKFELDIKFINKFIVWFAQDHANATLKDESFSRPIEATKIEFVAKKAKIVYNEEIKYLIEKDSSTTFINENTNGEAIFSISYNPFIRTKNGYLGNPATPILYKKTLERYTNGKETAKVLCSIGEYFDENGNLVISTKTPDKMLFEHYDKVVPMVRSGRRKELAMSYTADGLAKVFDVVGVRVFFDGAVWQELTLRESGEGIDIGRTTYTTIANNAGGLTYKITSNEIVTEENSASGITYIIGD